MKTRHILSSLGLGMALLGVTALYAAPIESPNPISFVPRDITYVVNVVNPWEPVGGSNCTYYILVTNEKGRAIAPAQPFRVGTLTYTVKEKGPVSGTRIAKLVLANNVICPGAWIYKVDVKAGVFSAGHTYQFNVTLAGQGISEW